MKMDLEERISAIVSDENIIKNEDMSRHTTFRTGGPADYFIKITTRAMLSEVLKAFGEAGFTYRRDYYVLGNGSNVLISDKGFRGYILSLTGEFNSAELIDDTHIRAGAGTANSAVAVLARDNALTGFEFAHGIPGTIGGALIMNAGAYGGEMKQVVKSVTAVTTAGETKQFTAEEADFGYRTSFFKGKDLILTDAVIELQKGDKDQIEETMNDLMGRRREKQPLEYPSAGSTFKRPEGHFAGKLIEDAGLKGLSVGGAQVSEKHCGFIINKGDATSADIDRLIKEVQAKVLEDSGIELSPEVIRLGDFEG
jgi:UDP-N-acetylmuramate dehydrogenase